MKIGNQVVPEINQIEIHPRLRQREAEVYKPVSCIQVEAWSAIGSGALVESNNVDTIAEKYGKTVASWPSVGISSTGAWCCRARAHARELRPVLLPAHQISGVSVRFVRSPWSRGPDPATMDNA